MISSDLVLVQRGLKLDADLENSPLEIKTDSSLGSDEKVNMWFYAESGIFVAGRLILHFTSPPQFTINSCTYETNFPIALPTDTNKVWRISLTRTSGIRLVIHCNEVEVLDYVLSDSTCSYRNWWDMWKREVKQIKFDKDEDTASDYYRGLAN